MSEEAPKEDKLRVLADDFVDFLTKMTPDAKCPACGEEYWTILSPSEESADTYKLQLTIKNAPRPRVISTFALSCNNCGFIRLHVAKIVRKWVEERDTTQCLDDEQNTDE